MQAGGSRSMIGRTRQSQDLNNEKRDQTKGWANQDRSLREPKKAAHRAERKLAKLGAMMSAFSDDNYETNQSEITVGEALELTFSATHRRH